MVQRIYAGTETRVKNGAMYSSRDFPARTATGYTLVDEASRGRAEATIEDILLLIEVAESSLSYDRATKLRLYAEAGVSEYWVIDVAAEGIEVHRAPDAGGYREVARLAGAPVSLLTFPDVSLTLAEVFA